MQPEAIRAFRKTWNPRATHKSHDRRTSRAVLGLAPKPAQGIPRASVAHPLPPPAAAALGALGQSVLDDGYSGVRRRPQCDSDLKALSRLVEERKNRAFPPLRSLAPRPPRSAQRIAAPQVVAEPSSARLDRRRNAREPTDPHVHVLAMYSLPPLPATESRDACLSVDMEWLEVVDDARSAEDFLTTVSTAAKKSQAWLSTTKHLLRVALLGTLIFIATGFAVAGERSPSGELTVSRTVDTHTLSAAVVSTMAIPATQLSIGTFPQLTAEAIVQGPAQVSTASEEPAPPAVARKRSARKRHLRTYYDVMKRKARTEDRSSTLR